MLAEAREPGHTTQLLFGDAPDELTLAGFQRRGMGDYHWTFYRGDQAQNARLGGSQSIRLLFIS